jgi:gas vesicle protein
MNEYQRYGDYSQQGYESSGTGAGSVITSLLIGAGIGALIALLFTPKNGNELRRAIGRGYRKTVDGVSQRTRELRDRGSNLLGFEQRGTTEVEKHYGQA